MSDFTTRHQDDYLIIANDTDLIFGTAMLGTAFGQIKQAMIRRTGEREMFSNKAGVLKLILIKNPGYEMTLKCAFDKSVVPPGIGESLSLPLVGVTGHVMEGVTVEWESGSERGLSIPVSSWDAFQGAVVYRLLPTTGELLEISGTLLTAPSAAPVLSGAETSSRHDLTWSTVARVALYELETSDDSGATWSVLALTAGQAFSVTGLDPGTTRSYRVRATNEAGDGPWSDTLELTTADAAPTEAPTLEAFIGGYNIALHWSSVTGADDVEVQVSADGGSTWTTLTTGAPGTSYLHLLSAANTTRKYRARFRNSSGDGPWSSVATQTTYGMFAPSLTLSPGTYTIVLNWSGQAFVVSHVVERSSDGGSTWSTVATTSGLTWTDTSLTLGDTRHYRVRAINSTENGPWSTMQAGALVDIGVPNPTALALTRTTQINVTWSPIAGATGYEMQMSTVADFSSVVTVLRSSTGTISIGPTQISSLVELGSWEVIRYFRARALMGTATGDWSTGVAATTCFDAATSPSWSGNTLSWTAPPGGPDRYRLYVISAGITFYMGTTTATSFNADTEGVGSWDWPADFFFVDNDVHVRAVRDSDNTEGAALVVPLPP